MNSHNRSFSRSLNILSKLLLVSLFAIFATTASAQLRTFTGYNNTTFPGNDDGSTSLVSLGFNANFFGSTYSQTYVNNNGNITFGGPLGTFTPFGLINASSVIIAPFFADVDTRASSPVTYGTGSLGGHNAFSVNWFNVGVYSTLPIYNTFQLVLIDRSDITAGDFDFEFNYTDINWETGQASGGNNSGLGGSPVRIGYSNGINASYELAGSGISGYFLDSNPATGLIYNQVGTPFDGAAMDGRYTFNVRNGVVIPPTVPVPEPSTYGLIGGLALFGMILARRMMRKVTKA